MSADSDKRRIGPFELDGKLGVGGMGIVYRATYLKGGQKVAVKVLAPDLTADKKVAKRFEREMAILKKLKHPNIVRYYGGGTSGQQQFYAMELVSGGSVDDLLRKRGRLPWREAADYGLQIARALEHAHDASIIHRDLKPANLLVSSDGVLKLSDFGIARDTQSTALTQAGKTVGTMAYMAPEQITGKTPVSRRTDLYALGCVLFQMLTGRTPFESKTQPEMLFKHLEEAPPNVRELNIDCPLALDRLIAQLLEKEPEERPHDALAVQTALESILKEPEATADQPQASITAGGIGVTRREADAAVIKGIARKKKKKGADAFTPWYEQLWFLLAALGVVLALGVWWAWPESEATMYARLQGLMQSEDTTQRTGAEDEVRAFLERFPDGPHVAEARAWLDEIAVITAERRLNNLVMRENLEPRNDGERLFVQARRFEQENDRLSALEAYEAMIVLLDDKPDLKPYVTLAARRIRDIRSRIDAAGDPLLFVRGEIAAADRLYQEGKTIKARDRWQAIVKIYAGKPEFDVLVGFCQARLTDAAKAIAESPVEVEPANATAVSTGE